LLWSASTAVAAAQTAAPPEAPATLNAVDFNFVGQANLGAPFQIDSGRLAETKGNPLRAVKLMHSPGERAILTFCERKLPERQNSNK
jgi:hypothetical protein